MTSGLFFTEQCFFYFRKVISNDFQRIQNPHGPDLRVVSIQIGKSGLTPERSKITDAGAGPAL